MLAPLNIGWDVAEFKEKSTIVDLGAVAFHDIRSHPCLCQDFAQALLKVPYTGSRDIERKDANHLPDEKRM